MATRTPTAGVAGGALLSVSVLLAAPATGEGERGVPAGAYEETDPSGSNVRNFTPCGSDCTSAASSDDKSVDGLTFRLDGETWAASGPVRLRPPACIGTEVPATVHYSFSTVTLEEEYFSTVDADICGFSRGFVIPTRPIRLSRLDL